MNHVPVLQACRRVLAGSVVAVGMLGFLSASANAADAPAPAPAAVKTAPAAKPKEIKVTASSRPAAPGGEAAVAKLTRTYFSQASLMAPELPAGAIEVPGRGGEAKITGVPAGISPTAVKVRATGDEL